MKLKNIGILQHMTENGQAGPIDIVFLMDNEATPAVRLIQGCEAQEVAQVLRKCADYIVEQDSESGRTSQDALH